jgi:polyisoprenoid-binding protein YceI
MQPQPRHRTAGPVSGQEDATPRIGQYEIDTRHSAISFRTRHLFGLAPVRGSFAIRSGTVRVAEPLAGSAISAEIDAASFRTRNSQRDRAVRSSVFLDADSHPSMTFATVRISGSVIAGTLTVRGVTKPVSLTVQEITVVPEGFTTRASTRIDRTEFGVTAARGLAGRYLDLTIEARCVRA